MMKTTGKGSPETYMTVSMEGVFITKVAQHGTEEGPVVQKVEFVFKTIKFEYKPQNNKDGSLGAGKIYSWDIPAGTVA
jgi:type VI protein secretion system component Hcp